ncbi:hypothetical protein FACS189456_4100 [Bacteroidia bacterium]|nr:hypothetical protein FACS189456_4100 [Bacteroidia bacterium]
MKKVLLGMSIGIGALLMASCADDYAGTKEVGDGVMLKNSTGTVLSTATSVKVETTIVGQATAEVYLLKNSERTFIKTATVSDDKVSEVLTFKELDLSRTIGNAATVLIEAKGFLYTYVVTVAAPYWEWSAAKSDTFSTMEQSAVANKVTFSLKVPWVNDFTKLVYSASTESGTITLTGGGTSDGDTYLFGSYDFVVSDAFAVDETQNQHHITITASYTVRDEVENTDYVLNSSYTFERNTTQDTYTKSLAYTFTEANEVSNVDPTLWGWQDELKTFYGLDGKEYVGTPTGDAAKQPVLYIANNKIYNLFNTGDYKLEFVLYTNPQGLGLTDRSLAQTALSAGGWQVYADLPLSGNAYYHVRIGGSNGEKGIGTLHLHKTLDGKVEFSLKYGDKRNIAKE